MARICPQCKKENPSAANICMFCGKKLLLGDERMSETDQLHAELAEAKEKITELRKQKQALEKANADFQRLLIIESLRNKKMQEKKGVDNSALIQILNKKNAEKENDIDIVNTIAEFEIVHITNNEKSLSELERIQKMLSDLYTEKQTLQQNYNKLLGQKKQYKAVLILCFVVIGCAVGLFAFNINLQSKDSKIKSLQSDISEKNDTISSLHSNITQLQITKQKLNTEIIDLQKTVNQKSTVIENKSTEIQNLTNENTNLSSTNRNLQSELREQKNQNQRLSSDLANTKKSNSTSISTSSFTHYKVTVSRAYCYYRCADNFYKTDCYYSQDETISVYYQFGGYGLTAGGYLKMSELTRY